MKKKRFTERWLNFCIERDLYFKENTPNLGALMSDIECLCYYSLAKKPNRWYQDPLTNEVVFEYN